MLAEDGGKVGGSCAKRMLRRRQGEAQAQGKDCQHREAAAAVSAKGQRCKSPRQNRTSAAAQFAPDEISRSAARKASQIRQSDERIGTAAARRHNLPLSSACQAAIAGNPIAKSRARFSNDRASAISGVNPNPAPSRMYAPSRTPTAFGTMKAAVRIA